MIKFSSFSILYCPKINACFVEATTHNILITLIEKWKKSVDNGGAFGTLLTDLSKAFNCLPRDLLIAKLDAYGFDKSSLKLIHSYLSNRKKSKNK